jgi:hypothetical protein
MLWQQQCSGVDQCVDHPNAHDKASRTEKILKPEDGSASGPAWPGLARHSRTKHEPSPVYCSSGVAFRTTILVQAPT